jgi:hypothetical protein
MEGGFGSKGDFSTPHGKRLLSGVKLPWDVGYRSLLRTCGNTVGIWAKSGHRKPSQFSRDQRN